MFGYLPWGKRLHRCRTIRHLQIRKTKETIGVFHISYFTRDNKSNHKRWPPVITGRTLRPAFRAPSLRTCGFWRVSRQKNDGMILGFFHWKIHLVGGCNLPLWKMKIKHVPNHQPESTRYFLLWKWHVDHENYQENHLGLSTIDHYYI